MKHPKSLKVNGRRYRLAVPFKRVSESITEGPFYSTVPKQEGVLWLPDAAYLSGIRARPTEMHRIVPQAPSVKSPPKPATRSSRRRRDEN